VRPPPKLSGFESELVVNKVHTRGFQPPKGARWHEALEFLCTRLECPSYLRIVRHATPAASMQLSPLLPWWTVFIDGEGGMVTPDEVAQQDRLGAHEEEKTLIVAEVRRRVGMRQPSDRRCREGHRVVVPQVPIHLIVELCVCACLHAVFGT
jgi:hypothetical protein